MRWRPDKQRALSALILGLLSSPATARAAVDELETVAVSQRQVQVHVTGDPKAVERTRETLKELFGRLDVSTTVLSTTDDGHESGETPLAVAYIDFTPPHTTVVIVDGATGDEVDRREFPDAKTLETSVEASTHVVYLVVETMLTREREEKSEASGPADAPSPAPPRPSETAPTPEPSPQATPIDQSVSASSSEPGAIAIDAAVAFAVTRLAPSRVRPGGGLGFEVSSISRGFGAAVYATTYAPSELEYGAASSFARASSLRGLLTQDISLNATFAVALAVGGGLEWLRLEPESAPSGVKVRSRSMFSPLITSLAGLRVRLAERAFLSAWAGVDFDLSNERLVAEVDGDRQLVLALSGMRPTMMLTASTPLGGDSRFGHIEGP